jgi:hypothetical protein
MHLLNKKPSRILDFETRSHPFVMSERGCQKKLRSVHQRAANAVSGCGSPCFCRVQRDHQSAIGEATKIDE